MDGYVPPIVEGLIKKFFNPDVMCEIRYEVCKKEHYRAQNLDAFVERVLSDKPDIIKNNDYVDNLYKKIAEDKQNGIVRQNLTIYQLADLHIDLNYTVGAKKWNCGDVVCCRGE